MLYRTNNLTFFSRRSLILLALLYVFYTIPLTLAAQLVDPASLEELMPRLGREDQLDVALQLSGLLSALIWSGFFALCPGLFKVRFFVFVLENLSHAFRRLLTLARKRLA